MSNELEPCPFCNGKAELNTMHNYNNRGGVVDACAIGCVKCGAHMTICYEDVLDMTVGDIINELTAKWNTRPDTVESAVVKGEDPMNIDIIQNGVNKAELNVTKTDNPDYLIELGTCVDFVIGSGLEAKVEIEDYGGFLIAKVSGESSDE